MKGDTLIFYGFEKAETADSKDVTKNWKANGSFIEKRVRAKYVIDFRSSLSKEKDFSASILVIIPAIAF